MVQAITTDNAPKAIGPYSQAVKANGFTFVSGQIPFDPHSGQLITGTIAEQTKQVLQNIASILQAAGSSLNQVVKTTVYLKDMADFDEMNRVYSQFFESTKPARVTVEVSRLPKDARIEIDAISAG